MKSSLSYVLLIAILISVLFCFVLMNVQPLSKTDPYSKDMAEETSLTNFLKKNRISSITTWDLTDDNTLSGEGEIAYCITRSPDNDDKNDSSSIKVLIVDGNGKQIYEDKFDYIEKIYTNHLTRKNSAQLVFEASVGRNGIIKILDYQKGKIITLLDSSKYNSKSIINAEIRPQFQTGIKTGSEPFQVLLNTGIGLSSPEEKFTEVFRFKEGNFVNVGKFSSTKLDDFIERSIAENKSK